MREGLLRLLGGCWVGAEVALQVVGAALPQAAQLGRHPRLGQALDGRGERRGE